MAVARSEKKRADEALLVREAAVRERKTRRWTIYKDAWKAITLGMLMRE